MNKWKDERKSSPISKASQATIGEFLSSIAKQTGSVLAGWIVALVGFAYTAWQGFRDGLPPLAALVSMASIVLFAVAAYRTFANERSKVIEAEGTTEQVTASKDREIAALQSRIVGFAKDLPVVIPEFPSGYLSPNAPPTVRTSKGIVFNPSILDIPLKPAQDAKYKIAFRSIPQIETKPSPLTPYLIKEEIDGTDTHVSGLIGEVVRIILDSMKDFEMQDLMFAVIYKFGETYCMSDWTLTLMRTQGRIQVFNVRHNTTAEMTPTE